MSFVQKILIRFVTLSHTDVGNKQEQSGTACGRFGNRQEQSGTACERFGNKREQLVNDSGTNGNSLWAILAEDDENKSYELAHCMSIKGLAENADETFDEVFGKLMVGI